MEDIDRETFPAARELSVLVFGDTADEIELAALDAARAFFGERVRLAVVPAYVVHDDGGSKAIGRDGLMWPEAAGKKYRARVAVRMIEPE